MSNGTLLINVKEASISVADRQPILIKIKIKNRQSIIIIIIIIIYKVKKTPMLAFIWRASIC